MSCATGSQVPLAREESRRGSAELLEGGDGGSDGGGDALLAPLCVRARCPARSMTSFMNGPILLGGIE